MKFAASAIFLLDRIKKTPIGDGAAAWSLNVLLPVAPSLEESLRIASQDWDGETVEFYVTDVGKRGKSVALHLVTGKPIHLEGLSDFMFAVHTDTDHRFHWRVTEISTGSAVTGMKPTEELAITAVTGICAKYGTEGVMTTVLSTRDQLAAAFANQDSVPPRLTPIERGTAEILRELGIDAKAGDFMEGGKRRRSEAK